MLTPPTLSLGAQLLLAGVTLIAATYDIRFRRIPNWLVLSGLIAGLTGNTVLFGLDGLAHSGEGLGLGFMLYFPLYLLRARGAGDVKLLAAVGSITGPGNCLWIALLTAILGGAIAIVVVALHGRVKRTMFNMAWIAHDLTRLRAPHRSSEELDVTKSQGLRLPHGAMILVGAFAFLIAVRLGVMPG